MSAVSPEVSNSATSLKAIDLSRYQSEQIAARLADVLAIPQAVQTVLHTTCYTVLVMLAVHALVFATGRQAGIPWLIATIYLLAIAVPMGGTIGLFRVAKTLIATSQDVLQLTLQTSQRVAEDYRSVRDGQHRLPTAGEIVEHVYEAIVLPAMEKSISKSLGMFGQPLFWIYRKTIGGGIRSLIVRLQSSQLTPEEVKQIEQRTEASFVELYQNGAVIQKSLETAIGYTRFIAQALRRGVLLPLTCLFGVVAFTALVPLVAFWCYWR